MFKIKAALAVFLIFALPIVSYGQGVSGEKETRKKYYPDGKLKSLCEYNKEGLLDGTCKTYDLAGVLFLEATYKDNMQTGCKTLYPNGSLQRVDTYRDGKLNGPSKGYYESGKVKFEAVYKDGKLNGPLRGYYESGMLKSELTYNKDGQAIGPFKQYYEHGQLKFETTYWNGQALGAWREYDENGNLK